MVDERTLLDAIIAAPDDDGPRQVYADWLLERGDRRGELIALELAIAQGRRDLEARARELREQLKDRLPLGTRYRRGFPELLPASGQLHELATLLAAAPYRSLYLSVTADDIPVLIANRLRSIDLLALFTRGLDVDAMRQLASWGELAQVRELYIDGPVDTVGLAAVLARCTSLRLLGIVAKLPGAPFVEVIAEHAPALTYLNLSQLALDYSTLRGLAELPLSWVRLSNNGLRAVDLEALAIERLEQLELAQNASGDDFTAYLATLDGRLRRYDVWKPTSPLGDRSLEILANAPIARGLVDLKLFQTEIGLAGVRALVTSPICALEGLDLSTSRIDDEAVTLLAGWPAARSLRLLKLDECAITNAGVCSLAASPHLHDLEELTFYRNPQLGTGIDRAFGERRRIVKGLPND
jgi:uncharacterized protein (TIGR02996 family)